MFTWKSQLQNMNHTRVTEVRSSLGHKVKRATSNLIGSQKNRQHCHLLEKRRSDPNNLTYKSKKKKNKPRKPDFNIR